MRKNKFQDKKRNYGIICFLIFLMGTGFYYTTVSGKNSFIMGEQRKIEELSMEIKETEEKISVTILGAVKNGGTFSMKKGDTIQDVLDFAGGVTKQADASSVHLKDAVFEEELIYIPMVGEKVETCIGYQHETVKKISAEEMKQSNGIVNINEADQKTLRYVPYIGDKKAQAIIEYRQENDGFTSIEEIKNVAGIGTKTFEKIKSYLTIE